MVGVLKRLAATLSPALVLALLIMPTGLWAFEVQFNSSDVGLFPSDWKSRGSAGRENYTVRTDLGGPYLQALSHSDSHSIAREVAVDLEGYPFFQFSWRALSLPEGGNEQSKETNDGALGVYVIFDEWSMPPMSIKYVWSSTLPEGTVTDSPYSPKTKIVVLRSGDENVGRWVREKVDVVSDFKRLFERHDLPKVRAIGLLTDSDNTGTSAAGDYRSFRFVQGEEIAASSP